MGRGLVLVIMFAQVLRQYRTVSTLPYTAIHRTHILHHNNMSSASVPSATQSMHRMDSVNSLVALDGLYKVAVIGSGNWGTTIAKVVAENTQMYTQLFDLTVKMWVHEEVLDGQNLTDIINTKHENVKYLPKIKLPANLVANPDLLDTVKDADILVFNIPHQFLPRIVGQMKGHIKPTARAISCLKGFELGSKGVELLSTFISDKLDIQCGALSGANIAIEVAKKKWSETTVAYQIPEDFRGEGHDISHLVLKALFHRPYFHVSVIEDVAGISIAGALKNVVALGCGFVEGLGWGNNAAAAIQRVGLGEMIKFGQMFFPESKVETYYRESAGVADLITTCSGGRNVKVAKLMATSGMSAHEAEAELLNGQSAQGIITAKEVHDWLTTCEKVEEYPLFEAVYQIVYNNVPMDRIPEMIEELGSLGPHIIRESSSDSE